MEYLRWRLGWIPGFGMIEEKSMHGRYSCWSQFGGHILRSLINKASRRSSMQASLQLELGS